MPARAVDAGTTTTVATPRPEGTPVRDGSLLRAPGLDRISIDLSDEGLGPLTLQAANGAGGLHVRLTAGDRAVGDALAGAADQLRRDLESGGTRLGSLDVGHRDSGSQGRAGQTGDGRPGTGRDASPTSGTSGVDRTRPTGLAGATATSLTSTSGLDLLI